MSLSHRVALALHLIACKGLRGEMQGFPAFQPTSEALERMPIDILE
jgi:hypothetical protein